MQGCLFVDSDVAAAAADVAVGVAAVVGTEQILVASSLSNSPPAVVQLGVLQI